jgi:hypothetical protein
MKKTLLASVILASFGFSAQAFATQAVVITGEACGMLTPSGFTVTSDTKKVSTNSANGNAMFQCKTDLPDYTGGVQHYDQASTGLQCGILTETGFVTTNDWHETISDSGQATLICKYNSKKN